VEIQALPNAGFRFDGWTGEGVADPGSASTTVTMDGNRTVIAGFVESEVEAPEATLINAPRGLINAKSYTVTVEGIGVVAYLYRVDEGNWSNEALVGMPLKFSVETDGIHTLSVIGKGAFETWQAIADATRAVWTVDTTPPLATVKNQPQGTVGDTSIEVVVGGKDVQFYRYRLDGGAFSMALPVKEPIKEADLVEGVHTLEVIGMDKAGNWQLESGATSASWTVDLTVPTAVLSDVPDSVTQETYAGIMVGGPNVDAYSYSIDDGASWSDAFDVDTIIEFTDLSEGAHTVYVNGFNATNGIWQDGGIGESTESATVYTWTVDLTAPDETTLAAASGKPASSVIVLTWPAVEDGLRGYRLWYSKSEIAEGNLGAATRLFPNITPGPSGYEEAFTVKGLSKGTTYYFAVKSVDEAGNASIISNVVSWTTAGTLPTITGVALTDGGNSGDNSAKRELQVTGTNFVGAAGSNMVRFVSSAAVFDVSSKAGIGTRITADVPSGAPVGVYRLRVINLNGTSALSPADQTYEVTEAPLPLPRVTHVSPALGKAGQAMTFTIRGQYFTGAEEFRFVKGGEVAFTQASPFVTATDTLIQVPIMLPETISKGRYDVQVETPDGFNTLSGAKFEVYEPVDLGAATGSTATTGGVEMPDDGVVPVEVTLSTDDREEVVPVSANRMEIEVTIDPGTEITLEDGTPYSGAIDPPRQVPVTEEIMAEINDPNAVVFTMGSAAEKLSLGEGQTMFVNLDITMPSNVEEPMVFLLEADGSLTVAGVDGVYGDQEIEAGGTVLATQADVPEEGYTTYTLGLLLDHMSTYVAGTVVEPIQETHRHGCFIDTAAYGSLPEPHVILLREFRDVYSLSSDMGRRFVEIYYRDSPAAADYIAERDGLRRLVRVGLLPVVGVSYAALYATPVQIVLGFVLMLTLIGALYLMIRRARASEARASGTGSDSF